MKRALDFAASLIGLVALLPFLFVVALILKLGGGGPVFYRQERVGLKGRRFSILKFRSMVANAAALGPQITVGDDPRITPLGHLLRVTKIDELPQLWNVICGDMSLVGPRPEIAKYVELYTAEQARVLELKPGITDPSSFAFFNEADLLARTENPESFYREKLMPEKIRINLEYAARASVGSDVLLIVATIAKAFGLHVDIFKLFSLKTPRFE